jgi:hypothetical protein
VINAWQLLSHSFLEFMRLVEIAMVHVLGFVEDKHCFNYVSFLKDKTTQSFGPSFKVSCYVFLEVFYYWQLSLLGCVWFMGWKSFMLYHMWQKGLSPYDNPFLPYILIPIKINESKVVNNLRRTIFQTITIKNSIIIIHKCDFTW